jgi:thymidylate kinase
MIPPIIAIEGLDGAGKSEVWKRLQKGPEFRELYFTAEFKSPVGRAIRADPGRYRDIHFKLFAFAADRAWLIRKIGSLTRRPKAVVWERYVDSAIAYRGAEYDLGRSKICAEYTADLNRVFPEAFRTLYLRISVAESLRRRRTGDPRLLRAVERRYRLLQGESGRRYITIDASGSRGDVFARTKAELRHVTSQLPT